jgi:hypothetical protein
MQYVPGDNPRKKRRELSAVIKARSSTLSYRLFFSVTGVIPRQKTRPVLDSAKPSKQAEEKEIEAARWRSDASESHGHP